MDKAIGPQPCALCFDRPAAIYCVADSCALCGACDKQMHSDSFFQNHLRVPLGEAGVQGEQSVMPVRPSPVFLGPFVKFQESGYSMRSYC